MGMTFKADSASAHVYPNPDGTAIVVNLYSRVKRQGHATKLMGRLCAWADAYQYTLLLQARVFDRDGFRSNSELVKFYEKFGFLIGEGQWMSRTPSQDLHVL